MKFAIQKTSGSDDISSPKGGRSAFAASSHWRRGVAKTLPATGRRRYQAAFTLAEVLAAMLLLAIVIPTAVEALHVSSRAGEVAVRKGVAARIADRILNESLVTTNWSNGVQSGTASEGALDFHWTLSNQAWPQDAMQLLTVEVTYQVQGINYSVRLNTLAGQTSQPATPAASGTAMN